MTISGTGFGSAANDYGTFRAGFPASIFERLARFGVGTPGQWVVDLGTGTGTLARGFTQRGCRVTGVDPDVRMIATARELDAKHGLVVEYVTATAEQTSLPTQCADVVSAGQCWHWFERTQAIKEVVRLLRSEGKLVIAHFDWLPLAGSMVKATEHLIEQFNPQWQLGGGRGMHPQWLPGLSEAGFGNIETFSYDVDVPYTPVGWRGRIRASAGVTAMTATVAQAFDAALASLLAERYPAERLAAPHRVFAIVAQTPSRR